MEVTFKASRDTLSLHTRDYFKVDFRAANFTPAAELNPCLDIKGMKARIVYLHPRGHPNSGEIVSVELSR